MQDTKYEYYGSTTRKGRPRQNPSINKMLQIGNVIVETHKLTIVNQGAMIASHDKMVDAHRDMTQSILLLAGKVR